MAVTHADLAPTPPRTLLGSKIGVFLMVLSILFGLLSFILSLIAEATRSQVMRIGSDGEGGGRNECSYSSSGKMPVLCAAGGFGALAIAMVMEHTYILVAVSKSPVLIYLDADTDPAKTITRQAGFFFFTTWVCFAVGEILLLIGISVESGHLKGWSIPRPTCLIIRQGVFSAAGVLGLSTVFLSSGLYMTALRAHRLFQEQETVQREVSGASILRASPPSASPGPRTADKTPIVRRDQNVRPLSQYLSNFDKNFVLV